MITQRKNMILVLLVLASLLLTSCAAPETAAPSEEEPTLQEPAVTAPTELRIAVLVETGPENDWDGTLIEAFDRVQEMAPHGLQIQDIAITEGALGDDGERVMREYAESGEYDIIWGHSTFYLDQIVNLMDEFPDIMWVVASAQAPGGNAYSVDKMLFEGSYLAGIIAGRTTVSNKIGSVGPYPIGTVNAEINGFLDGARSVNPDIEVVVTFVESWFDPVKSNEATLAQVAAGVDQIFMRADAFDACEETRIFCYGPFSDMTPLAPHSVVTNALGFWDPEIAYIIDEWYEHKVSGEPFDAPSDSMYTSRLADGGVALSAINENLISLIPQEVLDEVEQIKQSMMDGTFILEANQEQPVSD